MTSLLLRRIGTAIVVVTAAALLVPVGTAQASASKPVSSSPAKYAPLADPAPTTDISSTMPRTMRDDLTGDFLGRGYDQRMRDEVNKLNIYDPPSRGGKLEQSTDSDLEPTPDGVANDGIFLHSWADWAMEQYQYCQGCLQTVFSTFHLNSVYVASNGQNLFMTGTKGDTYYDSGSHPDAYGNFLYELPANGTCATLSCAGDLSKVNLPNIYEAADSSQRVIAATSLAAGYVDGHPYVAVGLSDGGVQIYDVRSTPRLTAQYVGMATPDGSQTPVTALAWDPAGSGLLAIGVVSWNSVGFMVNVDSTGVVLSSHTWTHQGGLNLEGGYPLSAAIGKGPQGEPVVAFGMSYGALVLVDPTTTTATPLSQTSQYINGIVAINPIPRTDGTPGGDDFAVSDQPTLDVTTGAGALLRWDGTTSALTYLPLGPGSGNSPLLVLPDRDSFRSWYPGLKEGRFNIHNDLGEPITVQLQADSAAGSGCWYAPSWLDALAFPTQAPVTVPVGNTSRNYPMGVYTAGPTGGCAAIDNTNLDWRGYLVITPTNRPADTTIVKIRFSTDMSVDVDEQVGGAPVVSIVNTHQQLAAFGLWTIEVAAPVTSAALTAPTVTGKRLTAPPLADSGPDTGQADDPHRPVYRFDVTGAQWSGAAGVPGQASARIPAMTAQGSIDNGANWIDLGQLMPVTTPTVSGTTLTLGPASFYFQDGTTGLKLSAPLTEVEVSFGGLTSKPVVLADLDLDPPPTNGGTTAVPVQSLMMSTSVTPRNDGVDQAPLDLTFTPANNTGGVVLTSDPRYGLIYYRNTNSNGLITGLYTPGDYQDYVSITPWRGAYPNDGTTLARTAATNPTAPTNGCVRETRSTAAKAHPPTCRPCSGDDQDHGHCGCPSHGRHQRHCRGHGGGGLGSGDPNLTHSYLSTTSTSAPVDAVMNDTGTPTAYVSPGITVNGNATKITATGTADAGVSLNGCAASCTLGAPTATAPAIYQAGSAADGPAVGLMFALLATTATKDLPFQVQPGQTVPKLAETTMTVSNDAASLYDSSQFATGARIDTSLVTAGQLVSLLAIPR